MIARKPQIPRCAWCRVPLPNHSARLYIEIFRESYGWLCGGCAYKREHPHADWTPAPRSPRLSQRERLFE